MADKNRTLELGRKITEPIGKSWFLGIGINQYLHYPNLNNAVRDVQGILEVLRDRYEIDNYFILFDAEATREGIINMLDKLVFEVQANDRLIIYYSGHGYYDQAGKGYWIPYDASREKTAHYIRNSSIRDFVSEINSRHTLLLIDSCFSGSLFVRGLNRSSTAFKELENRKSRWAICSGRSDEEVADGEPGKNSPFAESLIHLLSNNQNLYLSAGRLADEVIKLTRSNYKQLPEGSPLYGVGHQGGQYIFHLKTNEEEKVWGSAKGASSIANYKTYLKKYPKGQYSSLAKKSIAELEDNAAWQKVQALDHTESYNEYIRKHPNGLYIDEAKKKLQKLERNRKGHKGKDILIQAQESIKNFFNKKNINEFVDARDGQSYKTINVNGKMWMAENFNFKIENSWIYNDSDKGSKVYGRLYTLDAARKAAPTGWRLPLDEEWRELALIFGGCDDDSKDGGKMAYNSLITTEEGFCAVLGGEKNGSIYKNKGLVGYYWSGSNSINEYYWNYVFMKESQTLMRNNSHSLSGYSCRYIKE